MDKVNGINQIVEILQNRISARKAKSAKKSSSQTGKDSVHEAVSSRPTLDELKQDIAVQIRSLNRNSEGFYPAASNIFIENVLSWELGSDIRDDPEFKQLQKKVNETINESSQLKNDFSRLIQDLLNEP